MNHKTKYINFNNKRFIIDAEIAPLISNIWKLDIKTTSCCQGHCAPSCNHKTKIIKNLDNSATIEKIKGKHCNNYVQICFASGTDFEKFLDIVAEYEKDAEEGMYYNIDRSFAISKSPTDRWEMVPFFDNRGIELITKRFPIEEDQKHCFPKNHKTYGAFVEIGCKQNDFRLMPQLYFPRKHLKYVEDKIKLALK